MVLSFNWIIDLSWIIRSQNTLQAKWKGNALLSSVITSMLSILSIFLQSIPILSIYILQLFRTLGILGKYKLGFLLCKLLHQHIWFSIVFSHWNAYNQDQKNRGGIFLLFKYFLDNLRLNAFVQNVISKFVKVLPQKLNNSLLEKSWARFFAVAC